MFLAPMLAQMLHQSFHSRALRGTGTKEILRICEHSPVRRERGCIDFRDGLGNGIG